MKLTFLGVSDSAGVPVHNCTCSACQNERKSLTSLEPTCAYIQTSKGVILLDAGLDDLAKRFDGQKILAVFLTHFHADHCLGLLRLRYSQSQIPCYHPEDKIGFADLFKHAHALKWHMLAPFHSVFVQGISFTPLSLKHSKNTLGYIIKSKNACYAYLTDCAKIEAESLSFLQQHDIDICFIDACYDERKSVGNHLNYLQASAYAKQIGAKKTYLLHQGHETRAYILDNNVNLEYPYVEQGASFSL